MKGLQYAKEGLLAAQGKSGRCFWFLVLPFFYISCREKGGTVQRGTVLSFDLQDRTYGIGYTGLLFFKRLLWQLKRNRR